MVESGANGADDAGPGYGIGAVARRLGVPAPTLRTWNQRYGLGPSRRSPGGHRRYDEGDLLRLEEMNRLIKSGIAPADAAAQALRLSLPSPPAEAPAGPRGVAVPSMARLARAADALDGPTVAAAVAAALDSRGVRWTWQELVLPVFDRICRTQARTGSGIDVEHLFSDRLLAELHRYAERHPVPVTGRAVLLACAEDEQHSLPVHALAAGLAERGVDARTLGARVPNSALATAMRRLGPAVVFVWSQQETTGDPAPLAALPALRPPPRLVVGGNGWWEPLPRGVVRVHSFDEAVSAVLDALD
ncbi:MerR family transcriptional regulator [Nonomuraea cavernae]|uniref:Transcriptional regulator n=1 Tax=Nonomuraea cavernae TaxID=2045107 RepID=A0A917YNZ2_9ACTN|nr:MerR family transcriptional regulator [Nonomuraea cavernae]MCA2183700.1 MerR family transcriptional regulator [Nonomuraea cavernae]GGO61102.1 transcriptional regulator [Nonomuraea cavernae]